MWVMCGRRMFCSGEGLAVVRDDFDVPLRLTPTPPRRRGEGTARAEPLVPSPRQNGEKVPAGG